ncbi:MAG: prepilin-type N-terminal cleavage/methylation domain-containing protein [Erysipelotrichaceae bacterium]|nr:prepilin-type N-terminal cleavage/methylation domain-containing protein [Erysipelotrichaceae bacterium]
MSDTAKLSNKRGFSLSETLITVLLLGIVLSGISGGIVAAKNAYEKVVMKADGMTLLSTVAVSIEADLSTADLSAARQPKTIEIDDKEYCKFYSGIRGYSMYFFNPGLGSEYEGQICLMAPGDVVIPVATDKTHTDKLYSVLSEEPGETFRFENGCFKYKIYVKSKKNDKIIVEQEYVIRPYN